MSDTRTVFVVDDDAAVRSSLQFLLESAGYAVESFPSATEFMETYRPERPGCLVLDVRLEGLSGLDLQEQMLSQGVELPIIFITGHGTVPMAVQALQRGALDFLAKPFTEADLLKRIEQALAEDGRRRRSRAKREASSAKLDSLTAREREVLDLVVAGRTNKEIAAQLHISTKTVEAHRAKIMLKTQANNLVELVRMVDSQKAKPAALAAAGG
jgi:two-component system response regulator FixJ